MNGRRLGHKIKFVQTGVDAYKLFVLPKEMVQNKRRKNIHI